MKKYLKYLAYLFTFSLLVIISGIAVNSIYQGFPDISDLLTLSTAFAVSSSITLVIFLRGQGRKPDDQTMHTLVAISVKFIFELFLALIWFAMAKKTYISSVILFFILYLSFSIFSIAVILNILRKKVL